MPDEPSNLDTYTPGGDGLLEDHWRMQKDARLIRRALRWNIGPIKDKLEKRLSDALSQGVDTLGVRGLAAIGRVVTTMEGQNQADDHLEEKHGRIDEGKPTEAVKVVQGIDLEQI